MDTNAVQTRRCINEDTTAAYRCTKNKCTSGICIRNKSAFSLCYLPASKFWQRSEASCLVWSEQRCEQQKSSALNLESEICSNSRHETAAVLILILIKVPDRSRLHLSASPSPSLRPIRSISSAFLNLTYEPVGRQALSRLQGLKGFLFCVSKKLSASLLCVLLPRKSKRLLQRPA